MSGRYGRGGRPFGVVHLNPLRQEAVRRGLIKPGERSVDALPVEEFRTLTTILNDLPRPGRPLSAEGQRLVAAALLDNTPLSTLSIVCVSLTQKKRWTAEGGRFSLTLGEQEMYDRAEHVREACRQLGLVFQWRLVLADAWSVNLFPEATDLAINDAYCSLMATETQRRGLLPPVRWTTLMREKKNLFLRGLELARAEITKEMVRAEAERGETRFDSHRDKDHALELARRHIEWRAAEGVVFTELWGQQLGLSTESHRLRRWDNLVVPREVYPWHDFMPKYPHWPDSWH